MTCLLIDTAFDTCQVGLWRDDALYDSRIRTGEARHDVALAPLVAELLQAHNLKPSDLTGVAVTTGPGRFTSLRVGIAFARAFVLPHGIPLVGVSTGQIMQQAATTAKPGWLVIVKRGEVFVQTPDMADPLNRTFDQLPAWLDEQAPDTLTVIGAGVPTDWQAILPEPVSYNVWTALPLATIGQVASRQLANGSVSGQPVRPFYGTSTGAWDQPKA